MPRVTELVTSGQGDSSAHKAAIGVSFFLPNGNSPREGAVSGVTTEHTLFLLTTLHCDGIGDVGQMSFSKAASPSQELTLDLLLGSSGMTASWGCIPLASQSACQLWVSEDMLLGPAG